MKIFISYTSSDKEWAHWIAWKLREAGHEPFVHEWEVGAGHHIGRWMEERIKQADFLLGVFSNTYCEALFSQSERWAAYWQDPGGRTGFLVPVEVRKVIEWPAFVSPLKRLSLLDLNEVEAARRLIAFLETPKPPSEEPLFPGNPPAVPSPVAFTHDSEPLGGQRPNYPAAPEESRSIPDADTTIRCINEHEPKLQIFGREHEIEAIVGAVLAGKPALIAGGPGMGKTAVATMALYDPRVLAAFGRRRVFASLEAATEPRAILTKLVEQLGLPITGDDTSLFRLLENSVAERPLAAILDNAETVFEANRAESERLIRLVAVLEGLSLVVTIRGVPPRIPDEIVIEDLPKLSSDAAQQAFLKIAGDTFARDPDVPRLLEAVDGHALSIQLIAAQAAGSPSLAGLRESWEEAHAEILRRPGESESRLTSVRASLKLSLNTGRMQKTPLARRLLTILAHLPGGLNESVVASLLGDRGTVNKTKANEAVSCLHQLRLIERRPDSRLRMLTPLRECIKLDVPFIEPDRNRLIDRYLSLASKAHEIGTKKWQKVRDEVESEADNLDSVCDLAVITNLDHKDLYNGLRGLAELNTVSGIGAIGSIVRATSLVGGKTASKLNASCIFYLGRIALARSDSETARAHYEEALALYRRLGERSGEANCIQSLGDIASARSDPEAARAHYEQALALHRNIGNFLGEANCIHSLGDIARGQPDHEAARMRYEQALAMYRKIGDLLGEANCIQRLGDLAHAQSDNEAARARYEQALAMHRKIDSLLGEANCIQSLGNIAREQSDNEAAREGFEQALALYRKIGHVLGEANCIQTLGDIAHAQSDHEAAREGFQQALALYRKIGHYLGEANCIRRLGDIARAQLDHKAALARYEQALALYQRIGSLLGEAETTIRRGQARQAKGDTPGGLTDIEAGFSLYFKVAGREDRALPGWQAMHRALTCDDTAEAAKDRETARSAWTAIGRLDLIREWVDSP